MEFRSLTIIEDRNRNLVLRIDFLI